MTDCSQILRYFICSTTYFVRDLSIYKLFLEGLFFIDYIHSNKETKQGQPTATPDWRPEDESMWGSDGNKAGTAGVHEYFRRINEKVCQMGLLTAG